MIDIIIRDCGHGEWLPIIVVTDAKRMFSMRELYRGNRLPSYDEASLAAKTAWDESTTGNIIEFKKERGLFGVQERAPTMTENKMIEQARSEREKSQIGSVFLSLNGLYQDIEDILTSNIPDDSKLLAINAKNLAIGEITAQWV